MHKAGVDGVGAANKISSLARESELAVPALTTEVVSAGVGGGVWACGIASMIDIKAQKIEAVIELDLMVEICRLTGLGQLGLEKR